MEALGDSFYSFRLQAEEAGWDLTDVVIKTGDVRLPPKIEEDPEEASVTVVVVPEEEEEEIFEGQECDEEECEIEY